MFQVYHRVPSQPFGRGEYFESWRVYLKKKKTPKFVLMLQTNKNIKKIKNLGDDVKALRKIKMYSYWMIQIKSTDHTIVLSVRY